MQRIKSIKINKPIDYTDIFFILFFIFLGVAVRFLPVLLSAFPINDGGLFYQMTQDLLDNHFSLPAFISYNGSVIPFGYPPLAIYLMAFLQHIFHIGIISQLRFLPPFISALTIPAFHFLSKSITSSSPRSIFATFAFALMPASYIWLIMGGGITRSLGLLFGILAMLFVLEMFRKPTILFLLCSIIFCSLTILSHPATAWFLFLTCLLIGIFYGVHKKGILFAFLVAIGVFLITMPWWLTVFKNFGTLAFINALRTSGTIDPSVILFFFTSESFITILAVIALIGVFAELTRRKFFLIVWLFLIGIFAARNGQTFATIPAAMLFGSGVVWILFPGLVNHSGHVSDEVDSLADMFNFRMFKLTFSVLLIFVLISAISTQYYGNTLIKAISQYDRQAMEWISQNTPVDSNFVVVTGGEWFADSISEWFPTLTHRISITTVQGSEWSSNFDYQKTINNYNLLQPCATQGFSCILNWANDNSISYSYLYLGNSQLGIHEGLIPLAYSPAPTDKFQLVYENPGVLIYKMIGAP